MAKASNPTSLPFSAQIIDLARVRERLVEAAIAGRTEHHAACIATQQQRGGGQIPRTRQRALAKLAAAVERHFEGCIEALRTGATGWAAGELNLATKALQAFEKEHRQ